MTELPRELISAVLVRDATVSDQARAAVIKLLEGECPPRLTCGEREAARILGVGTMTLCNWRRGRRKGNPGPFPFTVYRTPAGTYRYDRHELCAYIEAKRNPGSVFVRRTGNG